MMKSTVVFIAKKHILDSIDFPSICVNNKPITRVKQTRILGVLIDETLSWQPQVTQVGKKCRGVLWTL
jgi:hypothetical protein